MNDLAPADFSCSLYGRCLITSVNTALTLSLLFRLADEMDRVSASIDTDGKPWGSIMCLYRNTELDQPTVSMIAELTKREAARNLKVASCVMLNVPQEKLDTITKHYSPMFPTMTTRLCSNLSFAVHWVNTTLKELACT